MVEALYCVAFEHEHDSLRSYGDGFHFFHNSLVDGIISPNKENWNQLPWYVGKCT